MARAIQLPLLIAIAIGANNLKTPSRPGHGPVRLCKSKYIKQLLKQAKDASGIQFCSMIMHSQYTMDGVLVPD